MTIYPFMFFLTHACRFTHLQHVQQLTKILVFSTVRVYAVSGRRKLLSGVVACLSMLPAGAVIVCLISAFRNWGVNYYAPSGYCLDRCLGLEARVLHGSMAIQHAKRETMAVRLLNHNSLKS